MGYDGWVIVETKLDSKQLEKDLQREKRILERYEKEAEKLLTMKSKAEKDLEPYQKETEALREQLKNIEEMTISEQEKQELIKGLEPELEKINEKYAKQIANYETINKKIVENTKNQELMKTQIEETSNKLRQSKMRDSIDDVGKSITKTIKKVGKWALAIFSVRSAYMAIRSAMSTLSQYNEQLANQINTIRLVFASALEPIVTRLVDLVYKLLTYVNYIAKAWFNVDLFASASAKAMKNGASSAEKMRKSMAGFDEMNVISDNSSGGASAGSGFVAPKDDVDLENTWIGWIARNKDIVLDVLTGIGIAIGLWKLGELFVGIVNVGEALSKVWSFLQPILTFIGANATVIGGIILIIGGLALAIQGLINYLKDPTWENFGKMLLGIGIIAGGVLLIFGGFPALITLIVGAVVALGVAIYKNWDNIVKFTKELVQKIKDAFGTAINWIKEKFNAMVSFFGSLISKIVGLFKTIGTKVGDAIGGAFKTVVNSVLKAIETILNKPINAINSLLDVINAVPGINLKTLPTFNLPRLAVGGIVNMPGRGVNYMGANIAERGPEGVIPLTNSQMMSELGKAIGQYVTINANITNTMNGRVISRELQKINNNSDFARNV